MEDIDITPRFTLADVARASSSPVASRLFALDGLTGQDVSTLMTLIAAAHTLLRAHGHPVPGESAPALVPGCDPSRGR